MATVKQTAYGGWSKCVQVSNGIIDLVITAEVGPRIIRVGFVGGDNLFYEDPAGLGKTGGGEWRIYGGHRLWHAPEVEPRTYYPDNVPVQIEEKGEFVRVIQPIEETTRIQKAMDITLSSDAAHVRVVHRLTNHNPWAVEFAPWALSVMAAGGVGIFPMPPRGPHPQNLLPVNSMTLWAFTDMSDPRWTWGRRYILLRQDSSRGPQKVGFDLRDGWVGYVNKGCLFLKRFERDLNATYADMGCNVETFTNEVMLEVETLGPLAKVEPSASVEHVEHWFLFRDVAAPSDDASVEKNVLPHVQRAMSL